MTIRNRRALPAFLSALALLGTIGLSSPSVVFAQTHENWVQHHHKLVAIGAGIATHHALKVAARNAKLHGKKLNWAERHPTLSAIGVGVVTNHEIKAHTAHQ